METVRKRSSGISSNGLRTWGMFFLLAGMLGKSILQNGLLNLGAVSFGQLLEQMQTSRAAMLYATLAGNCWTRPPATRCSGWWSVW